MHKSVDNKEIKKLDFLNNKESKMHSSISGLSFYSPFLNEPLWQDGDHLKLQLTPSQRDWLLDTGSLTKRLIEKSNDQLTVTILRQKWLYPYPSEIRLLHLPSNERALIREVILSGCDQPWVFARSIIPFNTFIQHKHALDNRPLGDLLFKDPTMKRDPIEVAKICNKHQYLPNSLTLDAPLWGRRSKFLLENRPLLVSEVFLKQLRISSTS